MRKTTVYLPEETKAALERLATSTGRSEADLIRQALATLTSGPPRPRPRGSLFTSGAGDVADRVDELLEGFGER